FLALPNLLDALVEYIAHVGGADAVETAQPHAAVVVHRHGFVDDRARYALRWLDHVRERAVLEHDAGANDVDDPDPTIDEFVGLVPVGVLDGDRDAHPRQFALAPDAQQPKHGSLDLGELVHAAHLHQRFRRRRVEAEHHRIDADVAEEPCG